MNSATASQIDDLAERTKIALVTMAGTLFAYVSPTIVTALIHSSGYSSHSAGLVVTANTIGTAIGGGLAVLLAKQRKWRAVCGASLFLMALADVLSATANSNEQLLAFRTCHGVAAGMLLGMTFAVMARRNRPERTLAIYLFLQLSIAGILIFVSGADAIERVGPKAIWISLAFFSLAASTLLPTIRTRREPSVESKKLPSRRADGYLIALMLIGIILYQTGEVAVYAFIIEIGLFSAVDVVFATKTVAVSLLIAAPVALAVSWRPISGNYTSPTVLATLFMAPAIGLLLLQGPWSFFLANVGFSVFFCVSCAYMFGLAAELDNIGRVAALASLASTIGESAGPTLGGILVEAGNYKLLISIGIVAIICAAAMFVLPGKAVDKRTHQCGTGNAEPPISLW